MGNDPATLATLSKKKKGRFIDYGTAHLHVIKIIGTYLCIRFMASTLILSLTYSWYRLCEVTDLVVGTSLHTLGGYLYSWLYVLNSLVT